MKYYYLIIIIMLIGCKRTLEPNVKNFERLLSTGNFELTIQNYSGGITGDSYKWGSAKIIFKDSLKVFYNSNLLHVYQKDNIDTNFVISKLTYKEVKKFIKEFEHNSEYGPSASCMFGDQDFLLASNDYKIRMYSTNYKDNYLKLLEIISLYSSYEDSVKSIKYIKVIQEERQGHN